MAEGGLRNRFGTKWNDLIHGAAIRMYKAPADPDAEAGPGPGRPVLNQIRHRALVFSLFKWLCLLFGIDILVGFMVYIVCFWVDSRHSFGGKPTYVVADAFYFSSTTLTTTGYGDDAPVSDLAKTLTSFYIILNSLYINFFIYPLLSHFFQLVEGRGFISLGRIVVSILYALIAVLIGVPCLVCFAELSWGNAFYTVIVSFSSTGFGDYSFANIQGRIFGSLWLLLSHLVNCRVCSMVAEAGDEFVVQKFELLSNSTLREAHTDADNLRRALDRARTEAGNLRRGAEGLQNDLDVARAEAERLKHELNEAEVGAKGLQDDLDGAKAGAELLKHEFDEAKAGAEVLRVDLNGVRAAAEVLRVDLNGANAAAEVLRRDLNGANAAAEHLKHELEAARAGARDKESSLQSEINEARREVSLVRKELNDILREETSSLRAGLEEAKNQLEEASKKPSSSSIRRKSERKKA